MARQGPNNSSKVLKVIAAMWALATLQLVAGNKLILMKNYDPERVQGKWYLQRINQIIIEDLHSDLECIEFTLKHDAKVEDLYEMSSHWFDENREYKKTVFNIVDDRTEKARYFFESDRDTVAVSILGTDYDNWLVAYGKNMGKDSYFVSSRAKKFPEQFTDAVEEILRINEVERGWSPVVNDDRCPAEH